MLALAAFACDGSRAAETTHFEAAEVEYREGNYDDALSGYQAFLERYPQSPLAPTVEMRLRSINREVSSVMERTGSPRPSYHGSDTEQSPPESPDAPVEPAELDEESAAEDHADEGSQD